MRREERHGADLADWRRASGDVARQFELFPIPACPKGNHLRECGVRREATETKRGPEFSARLYRQCIPAPAACNAVGVWAV